MLDACFRESYEITVNKTVFDSMGFELRRELSEDFFRDLFPDEILDLEKMVTEFVELQVYDFESLSRDYLNLSNCLLFRKRLKFMDKLNKNVGGDFKPLKFIEMLQFDLLEVLRVYFLRGIIIDYYGDSFILNKLDVVTYDVMHTIISTIFCYYSMIPIVVKRRKCNDLLSMYEVEEGEVSEGADNLKMQHLMENCLFRSMEKEMWSDVSYGLVTKKGCYEILDEGILYEMFVRFYDYHPYEVSVPSFFDTYTKLFLDNFNRTLLTIFEVVYDEDRVRKWLDSGLLDGYEGPVDPADFYGMKKKADLLLENFILVPYKYKESEWFVINKMNCSSDFKLPNLEGKTFHELSNYMLLYYHMLDIIYLYYQNFDNISFDILKALVKQEGAILSYSFEEFFRFYNVNSPHLNFRLRGESYLDDGELIKSELIVLLIMRFDSMLHDIKVSRKSEVYDEDEIVLDVSQPKQVVVVEQREAKVGLDNEIFLVMADLFETEDIKYKYHYERELPYVHNRKGYGDLFIKRIIRDSVKLRLKKFFKFKNISYKLFFDVLRSFKIIHTVRGFSCMDLHMSIGRSGWFKTHFFKFKCLARYC
jgi:hypothetical protein